MTKRLDQYKGRLTPQQVADGINVARQNASRLAADARLLLDAGRLPSAAALAALSIEESGKVSILRALVLARSDKEVRKEWSAYRRHTKKNIQWLLPSLIADGARSLEDFRPLFDPGAEHPYLLDQVKQIALYTDCLGEAHWSVPEEVIDEPLAHMLVSVAELFARGRQVTPEEIELWKKHVGPVWKASVDCMRRAVLNWHTEMIDHGLISAEDGDMEKFLYPDK